MDIYEFSQHILQLKKEKKFSEILSYFKEHKDSFSSEGIGTNKYLVSSIISALIELGYYNQIFDFLLVHKASLDAKSFFFLYKQLKDKTTMNRDFVNKFCDLWDPSLLDSNDCFTIEVERK